VFSSKSSGFRHFGSFRHVAKSLRHAKTRCPITQTARLERVKEFSSVAVRARHITTAPTARSTCRCLDTECCARSVRIARTVADSGPSVTSTRSTSHRTGLPSVRNKFTMSTSDPAAAGAAVVCAPSALTPCQQALAAESMPSAWPPLEPARGDIFQVRHGTDLVRVRYIPVREYNDLVRGDTFQVRQAPKTPLVCSNSKRFYPNPMLFWSNPK
jgi:hypothetical protein